LGHRAHFFRTCDLSARAIPLSATKFYTQTAAMSLYSLRQERSTNGTEGLSTTIVKWLRKQPKIIHAENRSMTGISQKQQDDKEL